MAQDRGISTTMITQEITRNRWEWREDLDGHPSPWDSEDPLSPDVPEDECAKRIMQIVYDRLNGTDNAVLEAYGILHNLDTITTDDGGVQQKHAHVHMVFKFDGRMTIEEIAKRAGVAQQFVERPKKGRYSYDNMLAYLVHAKDENKYQYNPAQVVTFAGIDYKDVVASHEHQWAQGRAIKKKAERKDDLQWMIEQILDGKLTREQILLTDGYMRVYADHKSKIDDALSVYGASRAAQLAEAIESGRVCTTFYFVNGLTGRGKTSLIALPICHALQAIYPHWRYVSLTSKNPFDEYNGEEIIIMDDFRGGEMSASEWLRLLDPYHASPAPARYKNKAAVAPLAIIITSSKSFEEFFWSTDGNHPNDEAMGQFIRRVNTVGVFDGVGTVMGYHPVHFDTVQNLYFERHVREWNPRKRRHVLEPRNEYYESEYGLELATCSMPVSEFVRLLTMIIAMRVAGIERADARPYQSETAAILDRYMSYNLRARRQLTAQQQQEQQQRAIDDMYPDDDPDAQYIPFDCEDDQKGQNHEQN